MKHKARAIIKIKDGAVGMPTLANTPSPKLGDNWGDWLESVGDWNKYHERRRKS